MGLFYFFLFKDGYGIGDLHLGVGPVSGHPTLTVFTILQFFAVYDNIAIYYIIILFIILLYYYWPYYNFTTTIIISPFLNNKKGDYN